RRGGSKKISAKSQVLYLNILLCSVGLLTFIVIWKLFSKSNDEYEQIFSYENYAHALAFLNSFEEHSKEIITPQTITTKEQRVDGKKRVIEIAARDDARTAENSSPRLNLFVVRHHLETIIKKYGKHRNNAHHLADKIIRESFAQGYDPLFVAAVIKSESAFNAFAKSYVGATGLMQIMPATSKVIEKFKDFTPVIGSSLTDPDYNLKLGIRYLRYLDEMFNNNKVLVLLAYNWGPGRVLDAFKGKRKVPPEVIKYATKILSDYAHWLKEAQKV
ncbi:MAG: lytic transglycosylase domain-containing protein, partial [Deltaproteobacteria bacterium]|nr:lytic transglycosylase domain-containing protein [Deltaproteobacteria bacterium]